MRKLSPSPLARSDITAIWISAVQRVGFTVVRTRDAYAASDGQGAIMIGEDDVLDVDDSCAQLIFHELCHALVEGPDAWTLPDWGLSNDGSGDVAREHAALRLGAALAGRFGLREELAPTTEYRAYYDRLPADVMDGAGDPAVPLARDAAVRAAEPPWRDGLIDALSETARLVRAEGHAALVTVHPTGGSFGPAQETCGTCAWIYVTQRGAERCRQTAGVARAGRRVARALPACERWEPPVDCLACGACCREAYHAVEIAPADRAIHRHPELVVRSEQRVELRRAGDRCAALVEDSEAGARRFACRVYADRPRVCRDFTAGSVNCRDARRRVGLGRP